MVALFKVGAGASAGASVHETNSHTKSIGYEHKVYFCTEGGYLFCNYYEYTRANKKEDWQKSALKHDPMSEDACFTYRQCDGDDTSPLQPGHDGSPTRMIGAKQLTILVCAVLLIVVITGTCIWKCNCCCKALVRIC